MALVQYIKKRSKKISLSFHDLNIIKKHVDNIESFWELGGQFNPVWKEKYDKTIKELEYKTKKVGVMFADEQDGVVIIGYSLCHNILDDFDYIDNEYQTKGLGLQIAKDRAFKWVTYYDTSKFKKIADGVPESIRPDLKKFIHRAQKYYKKHSLSKWVINFQNIKK